MEPFSIIGDYELVKVDRVLYGSKKDNFMLAKSKLSTSKFLTFYTLFLLVENENRQSHLQREIYGQAILNELKSMMGPTWGLSHSNLYPALAELEKDGYIVQGKSTVHGKRRIYHITDKGRKAFSDQKATYHRELVSSGVFYERILYRIYSNEAYKEVI